MNKSVRIVLAVAVFSIIGCGLVYLGIIIGGSGWTPWYARISSFQMPMFSTFNPGNWTHSNTYNHRMTGGYRMMGEYYFNPGIDIQPLTSEEVDAIIHEYLEDDSTGDLILGEIMIFDNHAYAQIIEKSTGIGALEVLIDPQTKEVYPEQGPNMIWNLKYSPMGSSSQFYGSGMMMGFGREGLEDLSIFPEDSENMPVDSDQAVGAAQKFLDQYHPGTQADEHADPFYGYYTIHVLRDGEVIGMLSVNGYSSQVFYHNWHGEFIQMSEH